MRWLTRFSLNNPVAIVILVILIAVSGVFSAFHLKEELMPDIAYPVIAVVTPYPGASPQSVAADVTHPLEEALKTVQGVKTVTSTSVQSVSEIQLELNLNADVSAVQQKVEQVVNGVGLPSAALKPSTQQFSFNTQPVVYFTVQSTSGSTDALRHAVNDIIVKGLQSVPGVASVQTGGASPQIVSIQFNLTKLSSYHLTLAQVVQILQADNTTVPVGTATVSGRVTAIQLNGSFNSLTDIRNEQIPVPSPVLSSPRTTMGGLTLSTVPLSDIANVSLQGVQDGSINRTNGRPSVFIGVVKTQEANTVQMAADVEAKLSSLESNLPKGITIVPLLDSANLVQASVTGMLREAVLGAIFAMIVILLFLRNWRTTLISVISIPLSLLAAFILLNQFNVTLNIMTLGGMAVATGRVVDDSIVVIENIYRNWRRGDGYGPPFILLSTAEVGHAITSSTITTIAVFGPLGLVNGVVGKIFLPFALTVICALVSSLFVALTVVPLLAWLFVAKLSFVQSGDVQLHQNETSALSKPVLRPWQIHYQKGLSWCLDHKLAVLSLTTVLFVASVLVLPLAGSTFIPASKEKYATISITMPTATPLNVTNEKARQVETIVHRMENTVAQMNVEVGSDPGQIDNTGNLVAQASAHFFLVLNPNTDVATFLANLRKQIAPIAQPATIEVKELVLGGATGSFGVIVTDSSPSADLTSSTEHITTALRSIASLANVQNNLAKSQPQVNVVPIVGKAASYGLTGLQIAKEVEDYFSTEKIGRATIGSGTYNIDVSVLAPTALNELSTIQALPIATPSGQVVRLDAVATVHSLETPVSVLHRDGSPYGLVTADFTTQNTGRATQQAEMAIANLHLPSDIKTQLSGDSQQQNQSFQELIEAILISVGLVYIIMLIAFGEWTAPLAILFSMPVALIGAFFATVLTQQPVSVSSLIGILMLMGIVVTNAIVLVDRVRHQRATGASIRAALLEAGTTRLRPILMTAIATIFALIPLAIGFAEGALISQGLAVVVIGGLMTSTALTLVIVPIIYELLNRKKHRWEQRQTVLSNT